MTFDASAAVGDDVEARNSEWNEQMRQYKCDFLADQMGLSGAKKQQFTDIYSRMDEELTRLREDLRKAEARIASLKDNATDVDYDQAIQTQLDLKGKECEVEKRYYAELRDVLTKKQLFELKRHERSFANILMRNIQKGRSK